MRDKSFLSSCLWFLFLLTVFCPALFGKIIYVDDDATGTNDGSSWEDAYIYLQDALADANSTEKPVEIRVAQGTYTPDKGAGITPGDREATFQLINGVTLIGGYVGLEEQDPNACDIELYESILSGDLNSDDLEIVELEKLSLDPTRTENSYHVVTGGNTDKTAILKGFIIKGGNADSSGGGIINEYGNPIIENCTFIENSALPGSGGGIDNYNSSPTITNCTFKRNSAGTGGAICCAWNSSPTITDCILYENLAVQTGGGIGCYRNSNPKIMDSIIIRNSAIRDGGGIHCIWGGANIENCVISENLSWAYGGGIFCEHTPPTIKHCSITRNVAEIGGGGIDCFVSNPVITNCIISGNKAITYHGGGIYCGWSSPSIMNCLIIENESAVDGGGIHCFSSIYGQSSPTVISCTIANNFAERGGGGICCENSSTLKATNCIIWENSASHAPQIFNRNAAANLLLSNCNVQGGWPGEGNIDVDPLFADPIKGDYHLKSQAGRWNQNSGSWIFDYITSPCIDVGDPNISIGDEPLPNGGIINMGAYGGTSQASKSYILSKIIYVDDDAPVSSVEDRNGGLNDGSSWENAYTFLQDALADANDSDKPVEIRVAQGIYKPSLFAPKPEQEPKQEQEQESVGRRRGETPDESGDEPDDKSESFHLINGVTLKGGFAGLSEPDPNERDIELFETILSGDLNDDDVPEDLIFDNIDRFLQSYSDNSECIIKGNSIDRTSVLDGFVITGGYLFQWAINGRGGTSPTDSGGGMLNVSSSPTVINCTFEKNRYAVYNHTGSSPVFTCCRFAYNFASGGGAIQNIDSNPEVSDCIFENNGAWVGGAICLRGECNATLSDCTFLENQARQSGGAIYNDDGNITVTNCIFNNNRIAESVINGPGGAIYICGDSTTVFEECSFIQNETPAHGGGIYAHNGILTLFKCKFYSNYAYSMGGGLFIGEDVLSSIDNCTFESNIANLGSAVSTVLKIEEYLTLNRCVLAGNCSLNTGSAVCGGRRGGLELIQCTLDGNVDRHGTSVIDFDSYIVRNSIIWDQRAFHVDDRPNINISFSDIRNSWLDKSRGNIDEDPLFADPGYWADVNDPNIVIEPNDPNAVWIEGDYHLKSQAGRWDTTTESWVIDDVTSPCIDAGDPDSQIGDEPFPNSGIINMGAYGGTAEASLSTYVLFGQASNPDPPDGSFGISPNAIISWSAGKDAVSHDVYFGFTNPPEFVRNQTETEFEPGQLYSQGLLPSQAQCYWRIDEVDSQGNIITGNVWEFKVHEYKGRFCFTGDTPVLVDGKLIPISEVTAGQNIGNNIGKVETVQEHERIFTLYDILLESGNSITVAENHFFMSEAGQWLSLHYLKEGEKLKTSKGSIGIKSITKQPISYVGKVYNLKIKGFDQYKVGEDAVIVRDY